MHLCQRGGISLTQDCETLHWPQHGSRVSCLVQTPYERLASCSSRCHVCMRAWRHS